ncbi:hypothetical protein V2J09_010223 [Rumex salicifolius]
MKDKKAREKDTDNRAKGIEPRGDKGEKKCRLVGGKAGELDDCGTVIHDCVDAHKLLEDLKAHTGYQPSSYRPCLNELKASDFGYFVFLNLGLN